MAIWILPKVAISWNRVSYPLSEALDLLRTNLFSASTFNFSPQLLNKLSSHRFTDFADFLHDANTRFDVPIHEIVLSLENAMLDRPYHPVILIRILNSEVTNRTDIFSVGLLFWELQDSIRTETKAREPA